MAHFSRLFQYFASAGNTRYEWGRSGPIAVSPAHRRKGPFRYDPFVREPCFCNIKPKYVNMADINVNAKIAAAPSSLAERPGAAPRRRAEPIWDIIELLFFAYRDFVGDPGRGAVQARLRPRPSPGAAFRQPQSRHEGRRPARDPQHHQAVARPRAQATGRSGLRGAEGRRAGPPAAAFVS